MEKIKYLLPLLLLLNWTQLFSQKLEGKFYTDEELRLISIRLIEGTECLEILDITNKEVSYLNTVINLSNSKIDNLNNMLVKQQEITNYQDLAYTELNRVYKNEIKSHRITRIKFTVSVALFGLTTIALITK